MPQPQAGQAGQPETDHGEATQLGALTYSAPMSMYKAIASVQVFPTLTKKLGFFLEINHIVKVFILIYVPKIEIH